MWLVLKMLWKSLARILRKLGWGALLVPVAAMGIALFGLHLWTAAAVVLALILAVWRPAPAAALVPGPMVTAGIAGPADPSARPPVHGGVGRPTTYRVVARTGVQL